MTVRNKKIEENNSKKEGEIVMMRHIWYYNVCEYKSNLIQICK